MKRHEFSVGDYVRACVADDGVSNQFTGMAGKVVGTYTNDENPNDVYYKVGFPKIINGFVRWDLELFCQLTMLSSNEVKKL